MLELQHCVISQGGFEVRADWSLSAGARLAVIGPSGAGKSTLLAGIAGFAPLAAGAIRWQGHEMPGRPDARPVAMLFQDHNLFPHLTVAQNVGLGLRPSLRLDRQEASKVREALEAVGLDGLDARRPAELSGGQQSRTALARVMVMARPIILLDEPFSALGPGQRIEMLALLRDVADRLDAILIMVTHDPAEAERLGGQISFVEEGVAAVPVDADAFFSDPPQGMQSYTGLR
jgi:thiamine transport system ATP-binding protein